MAPFELALDDFDFGPGAKRPPIHPLPSGLVGIVGAPLDLGGEEFHLFHRVVRSEQTSRQSHQVEPLVDGADEGAVVKVETVDLNPDFGHSGGVGAV